MRQRSSSSLDPRILVGFFLVVVAGGTLDLVLDQPRTVWSLHVLVEAFSILLSLGAILYIYRGWRRTGLDLERTRKALLVRNDEMEAWRRRASRLLKGLGGEIDRQLKEWQLTPAERQVALMLLKGFRHGEIAELQGVSERTIRQHSVAIYRKSGLRGRSELSAFFLEDLLLPLDGESGA